MIASMTPDRALKLAIDQLADVQLTGNTALEARQARIELTKIIVGLYIELYKIHAEFIEEQIKKLGALKDTLSGDK